MSWRLQKLSSYSVHMLHALNYYGATPSATALSANYYYYETVKMLQVLEVKDPSNVVGTMCSYCSAGRRAW